MTAPPLPYFFDEADLAANAKQPGDREKALSLTTDDLKWLKAVYLANHTARLANVPAMHVHRLLLSPDAGPLVTLAGAFVMRRPDDGEATLYTPWKGLTKFADIADLTGKLEHWLTESTGQRELLRYLSVEQRATALAATKIAISTQQIDGAVFQDQETVIEANQQHNITTMLAELLKLPTLRSMLDAILKNALIKRFPALDQRRTVMDSMDGSVASAAGHAETALKRSSLSLNDAVLHYYLNNHWPEGDYRVFTHPAHGVSSDADNQAWESALMEIAQSLTPHLRSSLETFWNSPMSNGLSRTDFFVHGLRDTYCVDLLLKRQKGLLSAEEYQRLMEVNLAGTDASTVSSDPVRIDKVRVTALHKHYAELASTLLIGTGDTGAFVYTQSRGVETSGNLGQIKSTVLSMLKSEGHDDTLFNFLTLEERGLFLSLEEQERMIVGEPIVGPVFEQLMTDIVAKQLQNLSYALSRYRESVGVLDPHALLDNALDVRALIDKRLLPVEANGRWSTRADQRRSAQPATVRADSAKQQLALLASVEHALEQQLEKHPAISTAATTVEHAEEGVRASLELLKPKFAHTLSTVLRSQLKLRAVSYTLGSVEQGMVQTVLDTPTRLKRGALNGFLPDVFSLAIQAAGASGLLHLASCFVLTERGGLDPKHSGKSILWTPALGFEAFSSLAPLLALLNKRLGHEDQRLGLLENLERAERLPGRAYTLAPLQLIHGDFLDHLQKPWVRLDTTSVARVLASNLPAQHRQDLLRLTALGVPLTGLQRAMDSVQSLITRQKLPAWLANASLEDQILHTELLAQYLNNAPEDKDYLSGIRTLERTAHHELHKQLKADMFDIDPDTLEIHFAARATSPARTQTLPEFALNHLHDLDTLRFKPQTLDQAKLPAGVNETYIKNLVRNLKVGEHHREVLKTALLGSEAQVATRKKRFNAQLPWQLMHYAHSEKLQERLSETGFDLIRQIMDMPDVIAREAVGGTSAIIRTLELLHARNKSTVKVPGVYLISSKEAATTTHILLAPYSPEHGIKEYENENALLAELKTPGALQRWVSKGVSATGQALFKRWMTSTSSTTTDVSLATRPVKGPLFNQLFADNAELLSRLLGFQSDTHGQSEWAAVKQVLSEDLDQALTFVTGRLAYPVTVWRSYRDIKASAEDLQEHHWGAAVKAFIRGMAQLAMLRASMTSHEPSAATDDSSATPWQRIDITAPERTRLQRHESSAVELSALTLDSALGLYSPSTGSQQYAPIDGKVYPLQKRGDRWIIRSHSVDGPYVLQNAAKQWVLDLPAQALRYDVIRRFKTWMAVRGGMNIEAHGMADIRQLFPVRARMIDEGLDLATTYAWNSFRNLQLLKDTSKSATPAHQVIKDFLDVPTVLPEHVTMIEKVVQDIFGALLAPTLRHGKSKRFIIGRATDDPENIFAFTVPADKEMRIFLAERFFLPKFDHYRNYLSDAAFPISTHARASTLIHELSHLVCKTEDIAYLDASRPFSDLIETSNPLARGLKTSLTQLQGRALSKQSSLAELFAVFNSHENIWEDLGDTSYETTDRAMAQVLRLSGQATLSDARALFKRDSTVRLAVQLGNADSVSWLITHLGRQLYTGTP